jgi:menaquinone-dependent protoporphyrinogen oxidase
VRDAIAIFYATRDGQAQRIAEHIWRRLNDGGGLPAPCNLLPVLPLAAELTQAAVIVLVAAVRYGKHLPEVDAFLRIYRTLPTPPPLALASVNLSARKLGKTTSSGNAYLRKTIARHRLAPAASAAFAGKLDYRRYSWRDRQIIRFIMLLTGGPTDLATCIEYTSWEAVDAFVAEVAALRAKTTR